MPQTYTPEFKKKIVRLHEEEGRTYKSITAEYGVSKAAISAWCKQFRDECQTSPNVKEDYDAMKEVLKLRKELEEMRKENLFLKKSHSHHWWHCILCEGNRLEAYRFINEYHGEFGIRWLLRRLCICPNAYYNYRKHRKEDYHTQKSEVLEQIKEICHSHNGGDGYKNIAVYLTRRGYAYSSTTIHKYMNMELGLRSIVRPKKQIISRGKHTKSWKIK